MREWKFIAVILIAPIAVIAAHAQDTSGGLVAPEISKPTPGHLLDQDYLTLDRRDRPSARRLAVGWHDAARPRHSAAGQ